MSLKIDMDNLKIAINEVSQGVNAVEAMAMGLLFAQDPYADGLNALSAYLTDADREVHKCLAVCLDSI